MRYSDHEQRLMDQRSGEELDRRAAKHQSHQDEIDALVEQTAAEKGQAAFFEVAETAQLIFLAKSEAQSLRQRDYISQRAFDELLLAECKRLCNGDELKARLLASAVVGS